MPWQANDLMAGGGACEANDRMRMKARGTDGNAQAAPSPEIPGRSDKEYAEGGAGRGARRGEAGNSAFYRSKAAESHAIAALRLGACSGGGPQQGRQPAFGGQQGPGAVAIACFLSPAIWRAAS